MADEAKREYYRAFITEPVESESAQKVIYELASDCLKMLDRIDVRKHNDTIFHHTIGTFLKALAHLQATGDIYISPKGDVHLQKHLQTMREFDRSISEAKRHRVKTGGAALPDVSPPAT